MWANYSIIRLNLHYKTQSGYSDTAPGLNGTALSTMRLKLMGLY